MAAAVETEAKQEERRAETPTERSRVRRHPERGHYDRETVHRILDEGQVCHVALIHEGAPVVIPMGYALQGESLVLHGSPRSRLMQSLANGAPMSAAVTLLDGLVLARSTFHHSMNYRSVVIQGRGEEVTDPEEKAAALEAFVEHLLPGRSREAREADAKELEATLVVRLPLTEASAKIRSGPPKEAARDQDLPVWAGILPLAKGYSTPLPDEGTGDSPLPPSVAGLLSAGQA